MNKNYALKIGIVISVILAVSIIISSIAILFVGAVLCAPKYIFLSPTCYSDNPDLTSHENYFIKKIVLEAVEDRLSVFSDTDDSIYYDEATDLEIIQLGKQYNIKHIFIIINDDFMDSVEKTEDGYRIIVQTNGMELSSSDCIYEIHMSSDYTITHFGLDP